jgi:hypothetical protein
MEWSDPVGMNVRGILRLAKTDMVANISPIVTAVCANCLPVKKQRRVAKAVKAGLVSGCQVLLRDPEQIRDETLLRVLFGLPPYWEPPIARPEPLWPYAQLQAYRWAAVILAYSVRNALDDLHAEHIPDWLMPTINRGLRNSIYEALLNAPSLGWRLSRLPRAFLSVTAETGQALRLPKSVQLMAWLGVTPSEHSWRRPRRLPVAQHGRGAGVRRGASGVQ